MRQIVRGFSLIELMIVVAVIGILAAIAIPNYREYVIKARRSDAQQLLMDAANREKQYLLDARAYTANVDSTGLSLAKEGWNCTTVATTCSNAYYNVTITVPVATPPTFTVTAAAIAGAGQEADGTLTVNSVGSKLRTTPSSDVIPW